MKPWVRTMLGGLLVVAALSATRVITGDAALTSTTTFSAALTLTIPILLAALAGMWSERAGIVNIGIEGMMIFGTWFGAFAAYKWGPWWGLALGVLGGVMGGMIHAIATVRFNVDHTVSGVAINGLAYGAMRYASAIAYDGKFSPSPSQKWPIPKLNTPVLAGGKLFGWKSPDTLGWLERKRWAFVSDVAAILRGCLRGVSLATLLAIALVALSAYVLWRTKVGLRLRSSGEAPAAAESLGVKVIRLRYLGLAVSGGLAGLGGAYLSVVANSSYVQGQTGGRGFIGIATMIFGNWRPAGIFAGSLLFGFADALTQLGTGTTIRGLFLLCALLAIPLFVVQLIRRKPKAAIVTAVVGGLFELIYLGVDEVPSRLAHATPYVVTLVVLAVAAQRLRPPAFAGRPYRSGDDH